MVATSDTFASKETWIALLGRRDTPVDGVEDYCTFLGRTLALRGIDLQQAQVPWAEEGRITGLRWLARQRPAWRGKWVIVQYTALSWSRRGFPFLALAVLGLLRRGGAKVAVVFHECKRQRGGSRWIDGFRGSCQDWVIRELHRGAERSVFTVPLDTVPCLAGGEQGAAFIPIGANIPEGSPQPPAAVGDAERTVAIFGLYQGPQVRQELLDVSIAARVAAKRGAKFRILFLGKGTAEASAEIAQAFNQLPIEISALGLLSPEKISDTLAQSDVMLCVRGKVNQCRGSTMAGVACGLPIVAFAGEVENTPLADAGLLLAAFPDANALGEALFRVLTESGLSQELREKSRRAQQKYFSWKLIAESFTSFLERRSN
jgi:glycosyltransferase involved in cell wall biosynthesis